MNQYWMTALVLGWFFLHIYVAGPWMLKLVTKNKIFKKVEVDGKVFFITAAVPIWIGFYTVKFGAWAVGYSIGYYKARKKPLQ